MNESDVVVVGSGAAALSAALTAAVGGASVTVLERSSLFGGTSAVSGGGMWLPGNTLDPDWTDDLEGAKRYLKKLTLGRIPDAVLDRFLAEAGSIPEFFAANSPLTFTADIGRPDYHAPWDGSSETSRTVFPTPFEVPRLKEMADRVRRPGPGGILPVQHSEERGMDGSDANENAINEIIQERLKKGIALRGLALVAGLIEGCLDAGVQFVSDTRAKELIVDDHEVVGVIAEHDGKQVEYRAKKGVVLASGGFEWNQELWSAFMAVPWDGPATPPFNEGDGLKMAAAAGAQLANLDKATYIPTSYIGEVYEDRPYSRMGSSGSAPGQIMVNTKGRRFANESLNYNDIGVVMSQFDPHTYEYPNSPAYAIGDSTSFDKATASPIDTVTGLKADRSKGDGYVVADTLRELAGKLGIDPDGLEQQVSEWNAIAATGADPVFQRGEKPWETHFMRQRGNDGIVIKPIEKGPFYGYRVRAGVFGTRGGPVINENAQVLDWNDKPIPGLYGAGNVVAHPFASSYPGGGGTLGPAVVFGHIAAKTILKQA